MGLKLGQYEARVVDGRTQVRKFVTDKWTRDRTLDQRCDDPDAGSLQNDKCVY